MEAERKIKEYEYMVRTTPKFIPEPIDEDWEVHKVFLVWLNDGGNRTNVVVFRREYVGVENE